MKNRLLAALSMMATGFFLCGCAGDVVGAAIPARNVNLTVAKMPVPYASPGIFKRYDASGDSVMSESWTRKFDASGISFNDKRTCTLVTRQHVVMAAHYKRPVPSTVVFHDRRGKRLERILVAAKNVYGDCAVGLLNLPVPAGYKIYPLLSASAAEAGLIGELVLVTDQNKRVFVHEVHGFGRAKGNSKMIFLKYDEKKQIGYGKRLVSGDSGNPSFVMRRGEPVLIETHHTGGSGAGPFYGDAVLQAQLAKAIRELGGSGKFRIVR